MRDHPERHYPKPWKLDDKTDKWTAQEKADLKAWLQQMTEWARIARIDIVRLEGAAHLPKGDPGDPPPPPE